MSNSKRYDPLFNKDPQITPIPVTAGVTPIVAAHETPPNSPINGSRMTLSKVKTSGGEIPVWIDAANRVCYPVKK